MAGKALFWLFESRSAQSRVGLGETLPGFDDGLYFETVPKSAEVILF